MSEAKMFKCDICGMMTSKIVEFGPKLSAKVIVGDKIQVGAMENGVVYQTCGEECCIKALRKCGKNLFHPHESKPKKKGGVE